MQVPVLLLREGTDTSQGKPQIISNIGACLHVVDTLKTTLGPRGMDKLIHLGRDTTISNDGATIMKLLEVEHPAAKALVDIAQSQDNEVGDGTTSVVLLAGEFLRNAKDLLEDGVAPQVIIKAYRQACNLAIAKLLAMAKVPSADTPALLKENLLKCAMTSLNSKLISSHGVEWSTEGAVSMTGGEFFGRMAVNAVDALDENMDLSLIGVKKVQGGSLSDSIFVEGVAFKKTFSYAGFEQQPKYFENPKILCLNIELELKAEKDNAEIRLKDPAQYQSIVDAEWEIIYEKLDNCVKSGAQIILSKLAIGDLATQYFADRNLFCAGRVPDEDMKRVCKSTNANVLTTVSKVTPDCLGACGLFEERQIGAERYNLFTQCKNAKSVTIILRGGADQFMDEAERSLHDAIMIVRKGKKQSAVVAGGGAVEMELSKHLREHARTIRGKAQIIMNLYAKALEVIPRCLADNAGFDSIDVMNKLRYMHAKKDEDGSLYGVDIETGGVCDTLAKYVWEPVDMKRNALYAATEAANLILSIDETVRNPKSEQPGDNTPVGGKGGKGTGGRGMAGMMAGRRGVKRLK
jgi:T-complex protein 1 subunit eta|eukprot:CAMPEP_0174285730 /NCGR_PEP_ID=MMETSP0809-20121228/9556_1 /TAXON_ID=73025 ORGANISM="Eutreptiella gymnastica-like, Strain CCMP1594" /NCGR_SAMPLE_ID=MMETSP0809 /ASSEMBLY_ACC=CAM_ASM_000658 /LENGTH=576 /DNA_ID=CAMNT_0015381577 /DNA_START=20 /DNA_END=1750 /DNA_ORIENTATION=-